MMLWVDQYFSQYMQDAVQVFYYISLHLKKGFITKPLPWWVARNHDKYKGQQWTARMCAAFKGCGSQWAGHASFTADLQLKSVETKGSLLADHMIVKDQYHRNLRDEASVLKECATSNYSIAMLWCIKLKQTKYLMVYSVWRTRMRQPKFWWLNWIKL